MRPYIPAHISSDAQFRGCFFTKILENLPLIYSCGGRYFRAVETHGRASVQIHTHIRVFLRKLPCNNSLIN